MIKPFNIRLQSREKKALLIGLLLIALIFLYYFFVWYSKTMVSTRENTEAKRLYLIKQVDKISEKDALTKKLEAARLKLRETEKRLLTGDKPPIAAAELQKLFKDMATLLGIEIRSERALNPVDMELYYAVPVEIGFTATTAKLKEMLLHIENSIFLLIIPEIKIRVMNISKPDELYVTLTARGFIKKSGVSAQKNQEQKAKI
ncbi:MAG: type II secretion system protein GspM [Nitrospirota bacterium]